MRQGLAVAVVALVGLVLLASVALPGLPAAGQTAPGNRQNLPLIARQVTPTSTATPVPLPVAAGSVIRFRGFGGQRFQGTVTASQFAGELRGYSVARPFGIFVVVLLNLVNLGNVSDWFGDSALRLYEPAFNRTFDEADYLAQAAARQQYARKGQYDDFQPTITYPAVVVFDVALPGGSYQFVTSAPW